MTTLQLFILSVIQGLTEFLPVSSSAHLILIPKIFGWPDQGLFFDVCVHFGTLLAVIGYFKNTLLLMLRDWLKPFFRQEHTEYSMLAWQLMLATLPVCVLGLLFHDLISQVMRSPLIIAGSTIIFGLILGFYDRLNINKLDKILTFKNAFIIGMYQILALIPGVSRSGITLTAGLACGYSREQAARFSFLLSIPVIVSAVSLELVDVVHHGVSINPWPLLAAMSISALVSYACIHFFLKLIAKIGLWPFVVYRLILGSTLFYYFL